MPLGSNLARSRRLIVSVDLLWEKNSKIFFSETTGHTALIVCMWQWIMVLYINYASHAPEVKFGHAPGVDSLHRLTMAWGGWIRSVSWDGRRESTVYSILYIRIQSDVSRDLY